MESILGRSSQLKQSFCVFLYNMRWLYRPTNQRTVQPTVLWSFLCLFLKPSYIHIYFIKKYYTPNPCQLTPDIILPFHFIYSPEHIVLSVHLLAPPALCPLTAIYQHITPFPKGSALIPASISRRSLFITARRWGTLSLIAWQMPLSWAYNFTITLAICTAGYLLKRGRLSTTLEGTKRWRPTWSLGQDSPQHHAITENTVGLSSI